MSKEKQMVAVLAAGLATRFGGGKLLAPLKGQPLFLWALSAAVAAELGPVLLVAGNRARELAGLLPSWPGVSVVTNPDPAAGQAGSLALAARQAIREEAELLVLLLADMPLVTPGLVRQVAGAARQSPDLASACRAGQQKSPPAAFGARHFSALANLRGDQGARGLLKVLPAVNWVDVDPSRLTDVDRPSQLTEAAELLGAASLYTAKA